MKAKRRHSFFKECAAYVLNELNATERARFEKHLESGCEECEREISEIEAALALMPAALPLPNLPAGSKDRLMSVVAPSKGVLRHRPSSAPPTLWRSRFAYAVAAFAVMLIVAVGMFLQIRFLESQVDEKDVTVTAQQKRLVSLQTELERKDELLKVLQSPRINIVKMNGLKPAIAGYGKIIWDPVNKSALFQVANLPLVPSGKDYQLWIIKKNKPSSAGVFAVTSSRDQENYFKLLDLDVGAASSQSVAFAVTLEPKGGVPQPTGEMYLLGSARAQ